MAKDTRPQVNIRAEPTDIELWQQAAKANGLTLSAWLRFVALKAARKDLTTAARKHAEEHWKASQALEGFLSTTR
jgi:uncharacterized protein (DUF1778 family)